MVTPLNSALLAAQPVAQELLAALVRLPTENPPGNVAEATAWLASYLEGRGHMVERHPVPAPFARHHNRADLENLVVRRVFGEGPTIALHAPLDTLPAGAGWNREPFGGEIREGRLYGRGARDSKADLAAYVAVLEALTATGHGSGTLELHITADEESGGFLGPAFLLSQGLTTPDMVIAAGTAYQVIVGQEGVLHLEVVLRGRQAHASRPRDGSDAILASLPILQALSVEADKSAMALTITTIGAGRGRNLVADRMRFTIDRRIAADESGDAVEAALQALIEGSHTVDGVSVECRRTLLAEPVTPTAPSMRLAHTLSRHAEAVFQQAIPVGSAPVVSGARHYALAGIPTALYGVGPPVIGEGVDMSGDEWVSLEDLERATLALGAAVGELLGG
ncbi:MAG: M20/M25/M40 family metallo-hydrolase [Pseudomonadota bacterium]